MKQYDYTKNPLIHSFETNTPKDIRANAVKRCCDAFKTGFTNLRKGNIKHFNMKYKKKTDAIQTIELTPKIISIQSGNIRIAPEFFKEDCVFRCHNNSKKRIMNLVIDHNVDIVRRKKEYYIHFTVPTESQICEHYKNVAGVDLGIRTFATVHTNNEETTFLTEYKHRADLLRKFNMKINLLKSLKRIRKKHIEKQEKKKKNLVDRLHWTFVNHLLENNDVIYLGDIKSHDIVNGGKNRALNLAFNDLKFFLLKQRLIYKASLCGKKVFMVPEQYTTKTCSCCGMINNNVGSKEVFECDHCKMVTGRDMNASKNMKLKGLFL
jgi:IS605 OrfB family transposase